MLDRYQQYHGPGGSGDAWLPGVEAAEDLAQAASDRADDIYGDYMASPQWFVADASVPVTQQLAEDMLEVLGGHMKPGEPEGEFAQRLVCRLVEIRNAAFDVVATAQALKVD